MSLRRAGRACVLLIGLAAAAGGRAPAAAAKPERSTAELPLPHHSIHLEYVKPAVPRQAPFLIVFASGDAGWSGASGEVFEHLAGSGYPLVGYSSREALKHTKKTGHTLTVAQVTAAVGSLIDTAKRHLGLPETTPAILTGFSRGASMVLVGAGDETTPLHVAGAIAMSLTREADYVHDPEAAARSRDIQMDEKGRALIYPAIRRFGEVPFALIQASGDRYVPAAEAREMFGPDTTARRLYVIEDASHGFGGRRDELLRDLDEALAWIAAAPPTRQP